MVLYNGTSMNDRPPLSGSTRHKTCTWPTAQDRLRKVVARPEDCFSPNFLAPPPRPPSHHQHLSLQGVIIHLVPRYKIASFFFSLHNAIQSQKQHEPELQKRIYFVNDYSLLMSMLKIALERTAKFPVAKWLPAFLLCCPLTVFSSWPKATLEKQCGLHVGACFGPLFQL